jgi:hypothetical protein
MPSTTTKVSELTSLTNASSDDLLLIVDDPSGSPQSKKITVGNLFNVSSNAAFSANVVFNANVALKYSNTPANSTISAQQGTIFYDSNYIYIAVANNTLKRVALSSF